MSARGAQHRPDLFESARGSERVVEADHEMDNLDPAAHDDELHDLYGAGKLDEDPLQLEHMIGFNGENHNAVMSLPNSDGAYVKR